MNFPKNLPLIVGGVAVAALGVFLWSKQSKAADLASGIMPALKDGSIGRIWGVQTNPGVFDVHYLVMRGPTQIDTRYAGPAILPSAPPTAFLVLTNTASLAPGENPLTTFNADPSSALILRKAVIAEAGHAGLLA